MRLEGCALGLGSTLIATSPPLAACRARSTVEKAPAAIGPSTSYPKAPMSRSALRTIGPATTPRRSPSVSRPQEQAAARRSLCSVRG
eukprot:4837148-Prymnesium_polylepis.2